MIGIALYQPDIPQNTAAIVRLSACLNMKVHLIEPCSFSLEDKRFKKVVMDYMNKNQIYRYESFQDLKEKNRRSRIILMTTKSSKSYLNFKYQQNDIFLLGRESKGVPEMIHKLADKKIKIPIKKETRSLNVAIAAAIISSEALRQTKLFQK